MKAIILAAGYAKRMRPLSRECHKTLLLAGGQTVLGRIVDSLLTNDVRELVIVTGYRDDQLRGYMAEEYGDLDVTWVHNPDFDTTNNIHSLALAFKEIKNEEVLIVESDLVVDPEVIKALVNSPYPDVAMVGPHELGMDGTVVTVADNVITQFIPPHLQPETFDFTDAFKTLNIYKFSAQFCDTVFRPTVDFYSQTIDSNCYYESILGILIYMRRCKIFAEVVDNNLWTEIDDPNDLEVANFMFTPEERSSILEGTHGGYWKYRFTDFCYIRNFHFPTGSMISDLRRNVKPLLANYGSSQQVLDRKISQFLECDADQIVLLNGASQAYPFLRQKFGDTRVLVPKPTFGEYRRIFPNARTYPDEPGIDMNRIEESLSTTDLVVFVNPNNPTGTVLPTEDLFDMASRHPKTVFLIDESFVDFCDETPVQDLLVDKHLDNVLIIKSLSKSLGVPGIRLGYVYSTNRELITTIKEEIPIWNINSMAEYFLELLFKNRPQLEASFQKSKDDRKEFAEALRTLEGVKDVVNGGGHFILVRVDPALFPSPKIVDDLLIQHATYVKDVTEAMGSSDTHLRFAVRDQRDNMRLVNILASLSAGS